MRVRCRISVLLLYLFSSIVVMISAETGKNRYVLEETGYTESGKVRIVLDGIPTDYVLFNGILHYPSYGIIGSSDIHPSEKEYFELTIKKETECKILIHSPLLGSIGISAALVPGSVYSVVEQSEESTGAFSNGPAESEAARGREIEIPETIQNFVKTVLNKIESEELKNYVLQFYKKKILHVYALKKDIQLSDEDRQKLHDILYQTGAFEKPPLWQRIIEVIAGITALLVFLGIPIGRLIFHAMKTNSDFVLSILHVIVIVFGIGLAAAALTGATIIVNSGYSPYVLSILLFTPGIFGFFSGGLGSIDEGDNIDTTHEWRYVSSGRRVGDATIRQVWDKLHGYGSWDKKIKTRRKTALVFGFILLVLVPVLLKRYLIVDFVTMSAGFFCAVVLGIFNYCISHIIFWWKPGYRKRKHKTALVFPLLLLNFAGFMLAVLSLYGICFFPAFRITLICLTAVAICLQSMIAWKGKEWIK